MKKLFLILMMIAPLTLIAQSVNSTSPEDRQLSKDVIEHQGGKILYDIVSYRVALTNEDGWQRYENYYDDKYYNKKAKAPKDVKFVSAKVVFLFYQKDSSLYINIERDKYYPDEFRENREYSDYYDMMLSLKVKTISFANEVGCMYICTPVKNGDPFTKKNEKLTSNTWYWLDITRDSRDDTYYFHLNCIDVEKSIIYEMRKENMILNENFWYEINPEFMFH